MKKSNNYFNGLIPKGSPGDLHSMRVEKVKENLRKMYNVKQAPYAVISGMILNGKSDDLIIMEIVRYLAPAPPPLPAIGPPGYPASAPPPVPAIGPPGYPAYHQLYGHQYGASQSWAGPPMQNDAFREAIAYEMEKFKKEERMKAEEKERLERKERDRKERDRKERERERRDKERKLEEQRVREREERKARGEQEKKAKEEEEKKKAKEEEEKKKAKEEEEKKKAKEEEEKKKAKEEEEKKKEKEGGSKAKRRKKPLKDMPVGEWVFHSILHSFIQHHRRPQVIFFCVCYVIVHKKKEIHTPYSKNRDLTCVFLIC
ncbi:unnamed protein product [Bemisia tabaci]|uniref:Uncharacterized protein n=2 Tax=Bemisia tabaci TaxID=7038 RepID=A0A9P0A0U3_BEMTA|nr:unnamed protein product [Bemisia tabaci]